MKVLIASLSGLVFLGVAAAQAPPALMPDEVLAASAAHSPAIQAAEADRRAAATLRMSARGAFDPVLSAEGRYRASGTYDGRVIETQVTQPLGPFGAEVYGRYRVSGGDFPIYEDEAFTNEAGEIKAGLLISLLKDRAIDERRWALNDARLAEREADLAALLATVSVQQRALSRYWEWLAAGEVLSVYRDQLAIAERRTDALERQVAGGAVPSIILTENDQVLARRRGLVAEARARFTEAAARLSVFYRDERGSPVTVAADRLPARWPIQSLAPAQPNEGPLPEVALLEAQLARALGLVLVKDNALRPRLDVKVELGSDLGPLGEGGISRDEPEAIVGMTFSVPLGQRTARADLERQIAKAERLRQLTRLTRDQLNAELLSLRARLEGAEAAVGFAEAEVQTATRMREAEQRRFEAGASDFFRLNLRDDAAASAQIRLVEARLAFVLAQAAYDAARVNLTAFGLDPRS
ncbi:outer membrane efflux protein [Parvularcula bermudensis HTCC2503]|uniref:Outer membrane efflux protein n=1 Tax=Parvularcula bermudensis (strain ATCC BAA-594 / HTCC2503 / KCTC 12087) TaxID=314260 RepID=E0THE1_PARBH|nr:TolC family protein [Parvularcula bermudensis]ADM10733.1 outer membrane efflux protein [Parvularcula bermudensis HTCC2503]